MSELPKGWAETTLDEIARWGSGGTPSRSNASNYGGGIPWIKTGELGPRVVFTTEETLSEQGLTSSSAKLFPKGAVAVAMYGATIGKTSILGIEASTNQACAVAVPDVAITTTEYLFHYLCSQREAFVDAGKGGAQPNISQGVIRPWPIPLPPLAEQKRIADKLDALLARVDACRGRLDRVPAILKRFRQSVLAAATSGELTREWREQNPALVDARSLSLKVESAHAAAGGHKQGNAAPPTDGVHDLTPELFPEGWALLTLRDLVRPDRPITYGILKPGPELEEGVPYVRVADFPNDELNLATIRRTSHAMDEEFKRSRLAPGDLLLSIRGTVGRLVVVPPELEGANITQDSARLSLQPELNAVYVLWCLRSPLVQQRMKAAMKGVAVRGINIGDVRALQVPLPSRAEQEQIVQRVASLLSFADELEQRCAGARKRAEKLTPSLLAKAFRGELVPQDPSDEPASVLLARLKGAEPVGAKKRKGKGAKA